jgi:adenylosuccinate synthase
VEHLLTSLGPVCAVIGAQWGDEGKGKAIDLLAEHFDVIARACGGANAGHTIVVNGKKHVFRLLPSGSLHQGKPVFLGAGMVIHLPTLLEEIATLEAAGISIANRLSISSQAHILFDFHKDIDAVREERRAKLLGKGIGTTKKGIGPAYMDKAARSGIRMERLFDDLRTALQRQSEETNQMYGLKIDVEAELKNIEEARKVLKGRIAPNLPMMLWQLRMEGKRILIEGAQATLLDIDHGTYPYVTSSQTTAAGALQGLGLAPKALTSCIGVAKAYCTRVGEGAFETEVEGETGDRLRKRGGEYGSVTGRPRRCGWLSLPDLKYAATVNGYDCWNITKLDVLDEEETIPVGIDVKDGKAVYKNFPGWKSSTQGITAFEKLPKNAQALLSFIETETGIPVRMIGTGQGREHMIIR